MIRVLVGLDGSGCLADLSVTGHASLAVGPYGANPVCAAATALVRSCSDALSRHRGVVVRGEAPEPGTLRLRVERIAWRERGWVRGVTAVLTCGVERLRDEAPGEMDVTVERKGEHDGSQEGRRQQQERA